MATHEHVHNLGLTKAIAVLQLLAKDLESEYKSKVGFAKNWQEGGRILGFTVKKLGITVTGSIWVTHDRVAIKYPTRWIPSRYTSKLESRIMARFETYFPSDHKQVA